MSVSSVISGIHETWLQKTEKPRTGLAAMQARRAGLGEKIDAHKETGARLKAEENGFSGGRLAHAFKGATVVAFQSLRAKMLDGRISKRIERLGLSSDQALHDMAEAAMPEHAPHLQEAWAEIKEDRTSIAEVRRFFKKTSQKCSTALSARSVNVSSANPAASTNAKIHTASALNALDLAQQGLVMLVNNLETPHQKLPEVGVPFGKKKYGNICAMVGDIVSPQSGIVNNWFRADMLRNTHAEIQSCISALEQTDAGLLDHMAEMSADTLRRAGPGVPAFHAALEDMRPYFSARVESRLTANVSPAPSARLNA